MTVNIYFKQGTPGVGAYDPALVQANVPGATSAFCSGVPRELISQREIE